MPRHPRVDRIGTPLGTRQSIASDARWNDEP
jgi:hypothetical protein